MLTASWPTTAASPTWSGAPASWPASCGRRGARAARPARPLTVPRGPRETEHGHGDGPELRRRLERVGETLDQLRGYL